MPALLLLNMAVLSFWLPAVHPCYVAIHPEEIAVEVGGSVKLNCTFSCTNYTNMEWEVPVEHVSKKGVGWISLSITNVTEWTLQPLCVVKYGESEEVLIKAIIYVYQFSTPNIYMVPKAVDGRSQRITCNVSSLKVGDSIPRNISIFLSRGGNILNSNHGKSSVAYSFEANLQQHNGSEILCVASVQVGSEVLEKSSKRMLRIVEVSTLNIYLASEIVDGRLGRITCNISSLKVGDAIPHNINISLTRGGNNLNSNHGHPSVEYSFVANFQQHDGAEILCVASVQVDSKVLKKSSKRILSIMASPYDVSISANVMRYKAGTRSVVTCNAKGKPSPEFLWDLPCKDGVHFSGSNNNNIIIRSAESSHNGTYRCLAHNPYGKSLVEVDILFEDKSRSWITALVLVSLLALVFIAGLFWYHCRK